MLNLYKRLLVLGSSHLVHTVNTSCELGSSQALPVNDWWIYATWSQTSTQLYMVNAKWLEHRTMTHREISYVHNLLVIIRDIDHH